MSLGLSGLGALSIVERFLLTLTQNPGIHYEEEPVECTKLLQRMLLRLQKFYLEVSYRNSTEMHMADPLSRAYLPLTKQESVDKETAWSLTDMRSPTEIETEHVGLFPFDN